MNGPAHGRFRFVVQRRVRPGPPVCGSLGGRGVALQDVKGAGGVVDERGGKLGIGIGGVGRVEHLLDDGVFETADAGEPPAGLDHFLDQEALTGVCGRESAVIFGD
jgi:hypothetical protein